jgi:DNA polymerase III subunit delta'
MLFKEIIGLESSKKSLIKAVTDNHVAHAQLFHGNEGSGALAMALAFATYINCQDKQVDDSCGKCASCTKMSKFAHPDVNYIFPTAGGKKVLSENFMAEWRSFLSENPYGDLSSWLEKISIKQGNIPVEEARQLIVNLSLKSYEGGYKIVIIWQAELLNIAAANALLKILEEPPEKTIFLLVCSQIDKILTTIISRTQRLAIPSFTEEDICEYLTKTDSVSLERAKQIAFLADGNLTKALNIIDSKDLDQHQWFANWMRYCFSFDVVKLVGLADEFDAQIKESQKGMFEYGLRILRELFLFANGAEKLVKLEGEELTFIQKFSKVFKIDNLDKIQKIISEAHYSIERNARAKMVFLDVSLSIARLIK